MIAAFGGNAYTLAAAPLLPWWAIVALTERLGRERDLDVRVIRAGKPQPGAGDDGTRLFTALSRSMSDIPRQRLAAIIMITDGQVHDVPGIEPAAIAQELAAPLH